MKHGPGPRPVRVAGIASGERTPPAGTSTSFTGESNKEEWNSRRNNRSPVRAYRGRLGRVSKTVKDDQGLTL
jgi:hypothetical protein